MVKGHAVVGVGLLDDARRRRVGNFGSRGRTGDLALQMAWQRADISSVLANF